MRAADRGKITEVDMIEQLLKIMETPPNPHTPPVGILTSASRPTWSQARQELLKSKNTTKIIHLP